MADYVIKDKRVMEPLDPGRVGFPVEGIAGSVSLLNVLPENARARYARPNSGELAAGPSSKELPQFPVLKGALPGRRHELIVKLEKVGVVKLMPNKSKVLSGIFWS